jgi:hypothetical protein
MPCHSPTLFGVVDAFWRKPLLQPTDMGRQVAYSSQFGTPVDRAHLGQSKIKSRLIGTCDPDEWDLPPKPKWMRWRTYNQHVQKFDAYENILDQGMFALVACLTSRS